MEGASADVDKGNGEVVEGEANEDDEAAEMEMGGADSADVGEEPHSTGGGQSDRGGNEDAAVAMSPTVVQQNETLAHESPDHAADMAEAGSEAGDVLPAAKRMR